MEKTKLKTKKLKFNHFNIEILLLPDDDERYVFKCEEDIHEINGDEFACCFEGSRTKPFGIAFRHGADSYVAVHECWHLFFKILRYMGGYTQRFCYEVFESEIYAYRFSDLYKMVYDTLKQLDKDEPKEKEK